jgi:RNA polymerase sigma factor (sigma-70 family)
MTMQDCTSEYISELYRRYGPVVYRRAYSLLRDGNEAMDVVQDSFLYFMRSETLAVDVASPFSMLYQIVTHRSIDLLRNRSKWAGILSSLDAPDLESSEQHAVEPASYEKGPARFEALHDLALLTHGESTQTVSAAVLYFVEGFSMSEIARELELTRKDVSLLLKGFVKRAHSRSVWLNRGVKS